jgi:hypothetical protein
MSTWGGGWKYGLALLSIVMPRNTDEFCDQKWQVGVPSPRRQRVLHRKWESEKYCMECGLGFFSMGMTRAMDEFCDQKWQVGMPCPLLDARPSSTENWDLRKMTQNLCEITKNQ